MEDFKVRLLDETKELASKLHKLQDYMRTEPFYFLGRVEKDLMYEQERTMNAYIQILGKRLDIHGIGFYE